MIKLHQYLEKQPQKKLHNKNQDLKKFIIRLNYRLVNLDN